MEKGTLSEASFAEFGKQVVLFCHITSRVNGDPHQDLLQQKGGQGFPHLVFMNAEGEVVAQPQGRSAEAFAKAHAAYLNCLELAKKLEAGDKSVAASFLASSRQFR